MEGVHQVIFLVVSIVILAIGSIVIRSETVLGNQKKILLAVTALIYIIVIFVTFQNDWRLEHGYFGSLDRASAWTRSHPGISLPSSIQKANARGANIHCQHPTRITALQKNVSDDLGVTIIATRNEEDVAHTLRGVLREMPFQKIRIWDIYGKNYSFHSPPQLNVHDNKSITCRYVDDYAQALLLSNQRIQIMLEDDVALAPKFHSRLKQLIESLDSLDPDWLWVKPIMPLDTVMSWFPKDVFFVAVMAIVVAIIVAWRKWKFCLILAVLFTLQSLWLGTNVWNEWVGFKQRSPGIFKYTNDAASVAIIFNRKSSLYGALMEHLIQQIDPCSGKPTDLAVGGKETCTRADGTTACYGLTPGIVQHVGVKFTERQPMRLQYKGYEVRVDMQTLVKDIPCGA